VAKKTYHHRTDLEKCRSQWRKLAGLYSRKEWSAAVVRAATAAEIAANYAIRKELGDQGRLSPKFIDNLLVWANGLSGKIDRLLAPLTEGGSRATAIRDLKGLARHISTNRNAIVHSGEFRNRDSATQVILKTKQFIEGLVRLYEPSFELRKTKKRNRPH
jgi:hypothetical protein